MVINLFITKCFKSYSNFISGLKTTKNNGWKILENKNTQVKIYQKSALFRAFIFNFFILRLKKNTIFAFNISKTAC